MSSIEQKYLTYTAESSEGPDEVSALPELNVAHFDL